MRTKPYWIKERHNPQTGVYYVACGQLSRTAAKKMERSIYGENSMLRFDSEVLYNATIKKLLRSGARFV